MASRRSSWGGAVETYWAAPAAARDHVAALGRPSTVCVPVGSARIARGGAQQQGDHDASITPIAGCQPDFGSQSINCGTIASCSGAISQTAFDAIPGQSIRFPYLI
jgi:hypothetical protein